MAIKQLTPEQVQSMSLEEKDAWWLKNVYRGDMPQLTLRSALTGMILGGLLSLTNLYVGARTGWTLGVGITSVILAFAFFKVLARANVGSEMTVLENNAMQSIATSAGYMTAPLISSLAAFTMVTGKIIPMWVAIAWMFLLAVLGVLFAFPMKKRFINDEQHPFPEGMAAGVVMDALHTSDEREGLLKAKLLVYGGAVSSLIEVARSETIMRVALALKAIPHYYDELIYKLGFKPTILGTPLTNLTIRWDTSIVFVATGGLMGIRTGVSLLVGGVLNYFILAPLLISKGIIVPKNPLAGVGYADISLWALWGGVACMTTSSLYAFFSKPKVLLQSFKGMLSRGEKKKDILEHIELPVRVSIIGIPILAIIVVLCGKVWFGIDYWLGALAIPLVFVFSLIATNVTALTGITPTGSLAKLTQLSYGLLAPKNITTNIMVSGVTGEVASNTANLLMDIKPGYMLGGKPRHQAIGHVLGAVAGLLVATPVWYFFLIAGDISRYGSEQLPVPGAVIWKAVSDVLMKGLDFLHPTARWAVFVGAFLGIFLEFVKQITKNRFPLSAVGLGLAFVLRFTDIWTMFLGAFAFWLIARRAQAHEPAALEGEVAPKDDYRTAPSAERPKRPWYVIAHDNHETICAGIIAGGALMGIGVTILELQFQVPELAKFGAGIAKLVLQK